MPWKSRRRVLTLLATLFGIGLLAVATLPFWLGPLGKAVLPRWGITFTTYERLSYGRFALRGVAYRIGGVRVTADRLESDTPVLWFWRNATKTSRQIRATGWKVDVFPAPDTARNPPAPDGQRGAMVLRRQLDRTAGILEDWLPAIAADDGAVTWKSGHLRIASATWQKRELRVKGLDFGFGAIDASAAFLADAGLAIDATSPGQDWQAQLEFRGANVNGAFLFWEQQAALSGSFGDRGWLPEALTVQAEKLAIPGDRLRLGEYYSQVRGAVRLDWAKGRVETSVDLAGEPLDGQSAPPLNVKLHGQGDERRLSIETVSVDAPGISARLEAPIELDREGAGLSRASVFRLTVDLAKQPWLSAEGVIAGEAKLTPHAGGWPTVESSLKGNGLRFRDWSGNVDTRAILEWPRVNVQQATVVTGQGDNLTFSGTWDFQAREFADVTLAGRVKGEAVSRWVPAKLKFANAKLDLKAHGPLATLEHNGVLEVSELSSETLRPTDLTATWQGKGTAVEISEAKARAGGAELLMAGSVDAKGAQVRSLRLIQSGVEQLSLTEPAAVQWKPGLDVQPFHVAGPAGSVDLAFRAGDRGRLLLKALNVSAELLRDFVLLRGPDWRVESLALDGNWERGPMVFTLAADVEFVLPQDRLAKVIVSGRGDGSGLKIEKLSVAQTDVPILSATARLPLQIDPGNPDGWVRFDVDAPLDLRVASVPNRPFWEEVSATTGIDLIQPAINASVAGTWRIPSGDLVVQADRVASASSRFPPVEALDLRLLFQRDGISVDHLQARIDGQAVRAKGELPLTAARWAEFRKDPLGFVRRQASLELEVPDAEVAAIARVFPRALAPTGRFHLKLTLAKGGKLDGAVRVTDAGSAPLGALGVFQNIQADLQLKGDTVEIRSLTAQAGGRQLRIGGTIRFPLDLPPDFAIQIKGEDLPFVRQTGMLLRGDIDLALRNPNGVPGISGSVKLRESVFLSDLRAIIPHESTTVPSRRPPFFAVDAAPFSRWRLDVAVDGDKFLRLRSTVFVGVASAHFRLAGTLGEPRAVGEAIVDSGQVLLPFATMAIEQGSVRLTEADPHSLALFISATARRYDYDLRMEITGTAAQPAVTFTSSPPLDPSQVLLLVMAGETPHDEVVYSATQRMSVLGAYLGQSLISSVGGDSSQAERMSISSGERISQQGRETYEIEYRLNDRFSLVGEYDEFDAYNAGLKYRLIAPERKSEAKPAPDAGREGGSQP